MHTVAIENRSDNEIHDDVMRSLLAGTGAGITGDEQLPAYTALPEELDLPPLEFPSTAAEQHELDAEVLSWEARKALRELARHCGPQAVEQAVRDVWAEFPPAKLDEFGRCQWRIYRLTMALGDARGQMEKLLHA